MRIFLLILSIPVFLFPITPTLDSYDSSHIVLSFPCSQNSNVYNIYRLPFISKRRDAKPRLYDKLFITEPTQNCIYEDWYPFDLTKRQEEFLEYIITAVDSESFLEGSFLEAYNNRIRLQKAKANFLINAENFCPETEINFINSSSGLVSDLQWYLEDELIGELEEISYNFPASGEYEIKLVAIGPIGMSSFAKEIEIHTPPKPEIRGENYACESTIIYTDEGMTDYKWYYEGVEIQGENSSSLNISEPGIYSVSYKDENSCVGQSDGFEFSHFPETVAEFEVSSQEIEAGQYLYFTNKSTGEDLKFFWEFGDGNKSYEEEPSYVYRKAGVYLASLTIKDRCGKVSSYEKQINVLPGLFEISKDNGTIEGGTPVTITGENFPQNPNVYIDNKICYVISSSSNKIELLTPKHFGGLDYYDIEIRDSNDILLYKMNKMFRFVNFGFVIFENKVSVVDMDKLEFYGWEIEIQTPKSIYLEGKYAYIGGKGAIYKFNSGTGMVEKIFNLEEEDQVYSIITENGLFGKYIFVSIYNQAKKPKGRILILDEDLNILAFSDFKGSQDGVGLEFEKARGKVYLLSNGPVSEEDDKEHKKKMIINIYNPMEEFEEEDDDDYDDGNFYLPISKILSKGKDSQNSYFIGAMTKTEDEERIYYGDPINQEIIEIKTDEDSFKGPDIQTTNNPISLLSIYSQDQNLILNLSKENSVLEVYNLPKNGKKELQNLITLTSFDCIEPKNITKFKNELIITCSNNKIIFIDSNTFNLVKEFLINETPEKIKVQKYEEESQ